MGRIVCDCFSLQMTLLTNIVNDIGSRGDLETKEVAALMDVSLRGEVTPSEALNPPPLSR